MKFLRERRLASPYTPKLGGLRWHTLIWGLSLYVAWVLNAPVLLRHFAQIQQEFGTGQALFRLSLEAALLAGATALLLTLARLLGMWVFRLLAGLMLVFSVLASYYMSFFKVVIGYGVVQAVLTTDVDLSKEAIGLGLLLWFVIGTAPGIYLLWRYRATGGMLTQAGLRRLGRGTFHALLALVAAGTAYAMLEHLGDQERKDDAVRIKPAVLAAHSYVPSNWLAGLGMSLSNQWSKAQREEAMKDPARLYDYTATAPLDDTLLVVVIGESARSTNFGLLGYSRPTTPRLAQNPEWAAFSAHSCNTSTKLSLQCMFVRPSAVKDHGLQAPEVLELPVFSVLKKMGFSIELFAMQSEVWFYNSVSADFYKIREVIAAEPQHAGQPSHDRFLLDEVAEALERHPKGKRVIILHTKGSHFLYTARYPREFAKFQPECAGLDAQCTQQQLINSYDNSIVYLDDFLTRLTGMLGQQKALVVYTSDHGESIGENVHFHATPKPLAPPEQSAVPLLMWASKPYLAQPMLAQRFVQLKTKASQREGRQAEPQVGHHNLFDSLLGCLGIASKQGGINEELNLCH